MRPLLSSIALACCTLAAPAWGAAGAEASLEHLSFTLVDLAPDDGILPSYEIVADPDLPNRQRTELSVFVDNALTAESDAAIQAAFSFIAPLSVARAVTGNSVAATSGADSLSIGALSEARGRAGGFSSAESNVLFSGDFGIRLSPMTALTISADATVTAFDQGQPGALDHAFEFAEAMAMLRVRAGDPGDGSGAQDSQSTRSVQTLVDAVADSLDQSGLLSVSFQNLGDGELFGYLSARSTVAAYGVTPVPEPGTAALVAAGLAALGWRARRRRC